MQLTHNFPTNVRYQQILYGKRNRLTLFCSREARSLAHAHTVLNLIWICVIHVGCRYRRRGRRCRNCCCDCLRWGGFYFDNGWGDSAGTTTMMTMRHCRRRRRRRLIRLKMSEIIWCCYFRHLTRLPFYLYTRGGKEKSHEPSKNRKVVLVTELFCFFFSSCRMETHL